MRVLTTRGIEKQNMRIEKQDARMHPFWPFFYPSKLFCRRERDQVARDKELIVKAGGGELNFSLIFVAARIGQSLIGQFLVSRESPRICQTVIGESAGKVGKIGGDSLAC